MATTEDRLAIRQLEAARTHLLKRGDADAVKSLDSIINRLDAPEMEPAAAPPDTTPTTHEDLVTAQEAAKILGVNSVSPVWHWVGEGRLTFRSVDGIHKITRASVEQLRNDPVVTTQQAFEADLARVFAPFEATDEDLREIYDWWPEQDEGEGD